jgi:small redox-active disulfide protein 2
MTTTQGEKEMKNIKVLGTGCATCKNTVKLIEEVARIKGEKIQLEKVEQIQDIANYRIMATPAVVIDGRVVHTGGVPSREKVDNWF